MANIYELYGLKVRSEVPLPAPLTTDTDVDVEVHIGERIATVPKEPAPGRLLISLDQGAGYGMEHVEADDEYVLRFFNYCECRISKDLKTVYIHPADDAAPEIESVILAGNILSFILAKRGRTVLHGSVVCKDEAALAFMGVSGQGKSTVAALLCGSGAEPFADDVVVLSKNGDSLECFSGTNEIRLRPKAASLAEINEHASPEETADNRTGLYFEAMQARRLPLKGIAMPWPDRDITKCEISRLSPADALVALLSYPRVLGWQDFTVVAQDLAFLTTVADTVPVYKVKIPWGPPFDKQVALDLLALLNEPGVLEGATE